MSDYVVAFLDDSGGIQKAIDHVEYPYIQSWNAHYTHMGYLNYPFKDAMIKVNTGNQMANLNVKYMNDFIKYHKYAQEYAKLVRTEDTLVEDVIKFDLKMTEELEANRISYADYYEAIVNYINSERPNPFEDDPMFLAVEKKFVMRTLI